MKILKKLLCFIFALFSFALVSCDESNETTDLDVINNYVITIDINDNGSIDIDYNIKWEVLDSTSEGPLSWVKIGIPNDHFEDLIKCSKSIDKISLMKENKESYARLDLNRDYYQGEVVELHFAIDDCYLYFADENTLTYQFTCGWFNEINVENYTIYWDATKTCLSTTLESIVEKDDKNYYTYNTPIDKEHSHTVTFKYNKSEFTTLDENYYPTYDGSTSGEGDVIIAFIIFFSILFAFILIIVIITTADQYEANRGFGGVHHHMYFRRYATPGYHRTGTPFVTPGTSSGHSSGHSCACACACACAGGGRAGCSRKEFSKIKLKKIYKINS